MRTKVFVMSMGLAASVWLTGCQNTSTTKQASCGANGAACSAKSGCKDGSCKDASCKGAQVADKTGTDKTTIAAKVGSRFKMPPSAVPAAPCTTCAKCGGKCGTPEPAAKSTEVAAASCSCTAKTGSVVTSAANPANSAPVIGVIPAQTINTLPTPVQQHTSQTIAPPPPTQTIGVLPAVGAPMPIHETVGIVTHTPASVTHVPAAGLGAGVEVVGGTGGQPTEIPAAIVPGQPMTAGNVMTVRLGQENNYQKVVGQVCQFRGAWKLRYTSVESDDRYGGSFTLIGDNIGNLRDGQLVQVEGMVIQTEDRAGGVRYQVNRIQVIEPEVK